MAEPRAPLPIAFRHEKRLSSAQTPRALPCSHRLREKPKLLDVYDTILPPAVRGAARKLCVVKGALPYLPSFFPKQVASYCAILAPGPALVACAPGLWHVRNTAQTAFRCEAMK